MEFFHIKISSFKVKKWPSKFRFHIARQRLRESRLLCREEMRVQMVGRSRRSSVKKYWRKTNRLFQQSQGECADARIKVSGRHEHNTTMQGFDREVA